MECIIEETRAHSVDPDYLKNVILEKSNHSYSCNKKITDVLNSTSWSDRPCFILGGGPSLKTFDFSCVNSQNTISINRAFASYPHSKINYSMDNDFYDKMKLCIYDNPGQETLWSKWMKYEGLRVFISPMVSKQFGSEVHLVKRRFYRSVCRDLEQGIYPGLNSGVGAIMLAIALGVSDIYLLGYDMKADESTHWHDGYIDKDVEEFKQKLNDYKRELEDISPLFDKLGVRIFNLNPDSALKCFPFIDISRALTHKG